jgi:hypothetical protein
MPPQSSGNSSSSSPLQRRRRRGRGRGGSGDQIRVVRSELLGSAPASNGGFTQLLGVVYPGEATLQGIARSYSEYRYVRFVLRLVPRCSSSTLGNSYVGYFASPPNELADLSQAASLARFRVGPAFGRVTTSGVDARARARRWLAISQADLTATQLVDPDFVQAWFVVGSSAVQSGVIPFDIYADYTIMFRGARAVSGSIAPAAVPRLHLAHAPFATDGDADPEELE